MLSSTCQTFQKRPNGKAKCTSKDESNRRQSRKVSYLKSRYILASAFELELSGSSAKPSKRKTYTRKRERERERERKRERNRRRCRYRYLLKRVAKIRSPILTVRCKNSRRFTKGNESFLPEINSLLS